MSVESKHAYRFGFLKSERWQNLRIQTLARWGAKCSFCGIKSTSNDVHHRKYTRNWNDVKIHDLTVLCRECHEKAHRLMKDNPGITWKKLRHLAKGGASGKFYAKFYGPKRAENTKRLTIYFAWLIHWVKQSRLL